MAASWYFNTLSSSGTIFSDKKIPPIACFYNRIPTWVLILLVVGAIPRILLTFGALPVLWPDSLTYLKSATLMAAEGNFWMHEVYRTPLYPLFLAIFLKVFDFGEQAGDCVVFVQRLLGVGSGFILFLALRRAFPHKVALWSAVLFLLSPLQLYYESVIQTEAQFIFLLMLFLWIVARIVSELKRAEVSRLSFVLLGVIAAIMSLSRPIGQLLLVLVLGCLLARFGLSKRMFSAVGIALIIFFVGLFPWMRVNHKHYGFWGISQDFGINLFHRILDVDQTPLPKESSDLFVRAATERAKLRGGTTYFRVYFNLIKEVRASHTKKQLTQLTVDKRMGGFAKEVLLSHPYLFIPNTVNNFWRLFVAPRRSIHFCGGRNNIPYLCSNHDGLQTLVVRADPDRLPEWARRWVHRLFRFLSLPEVFLMAFGIVGVGRSITGQGWEHRLLYLIVIIYFTGLAALLNCPEDRFRLPIDGLIYAFSVYGVFIVGKWGYYIRWRQLRV